MLLAEQINEWLKAHNNRNAMTVKIHDRSKPMAAVNEVGVCRKAAKAGCDALLRAHLRKGMHWITDRAVFDATCARLRRGE